MNVNKCLVAGNLTRDPELRYLPNSTAVVGFGIAINRRWKNQAGQPQEEVTFLDIEAFARTAEVINEHFRKGSPIFVEGRLKLDQWQDKEGQNRSKLKVICENFQFVGGKQDRDPAGEVERAATQAPRMASAGRGKAQQLQDHAPITEDDIPF